jgi:hypothetical protein
LAEQGSWLLLSLFVEAEHVIGLLKMLDLEPGEHGLNYFEEVLGMQGKLHKLDEIVVGQDAVLVEEM